MNDFIVNMACIIICWELVCLVLDALNAQHNHGEIRSDKRP